MTRAEFLSRQGDLFPELLLAGIVASGQLVFLSQLSTAGAPAAQRGRTAGRMLLTSNPTPRKIDLLRGSTADQSGLPDFQD